MRLTAQQVVHKPQKGANPTLATIRNIRMVLQQAGQPLSRNAILDALAKLGHGTTRPNLNAAIELMFEDGRAVEGSKGLQWVPDADGTIFDTILRKRAL